MGLKKMIRMHLVCYHLYFMYDSLIKLFSDAEDKFDQIMKDLESNFGDLVSNGLSINKRVLLGNFIFSHLINELIV